MVYKASEAFDHFFLSSHILSLSSLNNNTIKQDPYLSHTPTATMTDNQEKEVPKDANVGWLDESSEKKENYRVKASEYNIKEASEGGNQANASGPSFQGVNVHWEVGSSGAPSEDVQDQTAITWYVT